MPRKRRSAPAGIPLHLVQRGNNRQACFARDEDFDAYGHWLRLYANKYEVSIHAWVLMTNHVHLLLTPQQPNAVSRLMQSLGRCYVRYFNQAYRRSGTLWEGRFKSCLVQTDTYLINCLRYIELNPVRAAMVFDPGHYRWSSYGAHAKGIKSPMHTPHPEYIKLGQTPDDRQSAYKALMRSHLDPNLVADIRESTQSGLALGNDRFRAEIEVLTGRKVGAGRED